MAIYAPHYYSGGVKV